MKTIWLVYVVDEAEECPFPREFHFDTRPIASRFIRSLKGRAVGVSGPTSIEVYETLAEVHWVRR